MNTYRIVFVCTILLLLASCGTSKKSRRSDAASTIKKDQESNVLEKYSKILGEQVYDEQLYNFINGWMGVPYKYGGKTKAGIDCSNFSCRLLKDVYSFPKNFYFPSSGLAKQGKKIKKASAKEGDLVFFSINRNSKVSHVGVYLANNKFVHASSSQGIMISSLNQDYYKKRFAFIRRLREL